MQIKSWNLQDIKNKFFGLQKWQIVIAGIIAQIVEIIIIFIYTVEINKGSSEFHEIGLVIIFFLSYSAFMIFCGGIISLLLYFEKTRKIGAIASILLGIGNLIFFVNDYGFRGILFFGIFPIFLLIAGGSFFWKIKIELK